MQDNKKNRGDFVTLKYIVQQYMLFRRETTLSNYALYYQCAVKAFKELSYDVSGTLKVHICEILPNQTIKVPCDYVAYNRIGRVNGKHISWLGLNADLAIDRCGKVLNGGEGGRGFGDFFNDDNFFLERGYSGCDYSGFYPYGIGGGNNVHGYYKEDRDKGLILFNDIRSGEIILEYISNGKSEDGEFFAHAFMEDAITNFIRWKSIVFIDTIPMNEKQQAEANFMKSQKTLNSRNKAFTVEEYLQARRKNMMASPKT